MAQKLPDITARHQAGSCVFISEIKKLDGSTNLTPAQQRLILDDPANLQPLNGSMNCSKSNCVMDGAEPWLTYKGQPLNVEYQGWLKDAQIRLRKSLMDKIGQMLSSAP